MTAAPTVARSQWGVHTESQDIVRTATRKKNLKRSKKMDYKILVLFADGYFEEILCATLTDVENNVVNVVRRADGVRSKVVSMTVIRPNTN